jgi:hypothetical protein
MRFLSGGTNTPYMTYRTYKSDSSLVIKEAIGRYDVRSSLNDSGAQRPTSHLSLPFLPRTALGDTPRNLLNARLNEASD